MDYYISNNKKQPIYWYYFLDKQSPALAQAQCNLG